MTKSTSRVAARPANATASDNSMLGYVVAALVLMVVGFAGVWFFQQYRDQAALAQTQNAYTPPVPIITQTGKNSVAAKFVIGTSLADIDWVQENRKALEDVFQATLADTDMKHVLAPGGLLGLQERLREAGNAALKTDKLREVLLTDFLVGETSG